MSKRICLGKITAPHGVKGLVKIMPFGEDPLLIEELCPAYQGKQGDSDTALSITIKSTSGKYLLCQIEGCDDRNASEALKGTELYYDRDRLPETDQEDGEFYYEDLQGLTIIQNGEAIGTLKAVQNFGASDLFEVHAKQGANFYIPYTGDYIGEINLENRTIEAFNIEDFQGD